MQKSWVASVSNRADKNYTPQEQKLAASRVNEAEFELIGVLYEKDLGEANDAVSALKNALRDNQYPITWPEATSSKESRKLRLKEISDAAQKLIEKLSPTQAHINFGQENEVRPVVEAYKAALEQYIEVCLSEQHSKNIFHYTV